MSTSSVGVRLTDHFGTIPDPRINRRKSHNLIDVLVIAVCAVVSGAVDFVHIAQCGNAKLQWFKERL